MSSKVGYSTPLLHVAEINLLEGLRPLIGLRGETNAGSNHVRRWPDTLVPEIDFSLAAMMSHVNIHREQDFSPGEISIGRVVRLVELRGGKVWDHGGAVVERVA